MYTLAISGKYKFIIGVGQGLKPLMVKIFMKIRHVTIFSTASLELMHIYTDNFDIGGNADYLHLTNYILQHQIHASEEMNS